MLLNKALLMAVVSISSTTAVAKDRVSCPEKITVGVGTRALEGAEVFEGLPKKLAVLMPDLETWRWELAIEQANAKKTNDHLYLVCHFAGTLKTVTFEIPYSATLCKVEGSPMGTSAGCAAKSAASPNVQRSANKSK
jgi:hypothetical protein